MGGVKTVLRPDPFYVDQALSTLENLASMGIPVLCNQWINLPPNPDVINIDARFKSFSSTFKDQGRQKKSCQILNSN